MRRVALATVALLQSAPGVPGGESIIRPVPRLAR